MDKLLEILEGVRPDVDFTIETALITEGILDSFDIVAIVSEINDTYGLHIGVKDLLPENFESAEEIYALIQSKK